MRRQRQAFTIIELLVVMGIIGVLAAIVIPVVASAREAARAHACQERLRQIGLAVIAYEAMHKYMPEGRMTPDFAVGGDVVADHTFYPRRLDNTPPTTTGYRSVHTFLLPHLEFSNSYSKLSFDTPLYQQLVELTQVEDQIIERPVNPNFAAFREVGSFFVCPSETNVSRRSTDNSYRYNFGGSTHYAGARDPTDNTATGVTVPSGSPRKRFSIRGNGAFTIGDRLRISDFKDGMANTALFSERVTGSGVGTDTDPLGQGDIRFSGDAKLQLLAPDEFYTLCAEWPNEGQAPVGSHTFRMAGRWTGGENPSYGWPFAFYASSMYNHVAPPNWQRFDCGQYNATPDVPGEHAIIAARSYHSGGVSVVMGDGSTRFVGDTVDPQAWRAIGTREGAEMVKSLD